MDKIETPDDVSGKSPEELQDMHKELSFQLRIINSALKSHVRETKIRKFFERYPYQIDSVKADDGTMVKQAVKVDVDKVLENDDAGVGFNDLGFPVWGYSYGTGGVSFNVVSDPSEVRKRLKLEEIFDQVGFLKNMRETSEEKAKRHEKILEGFELN